LLLPPFPKLVCLFFLFPHGSITPVRTPAVPKPATPSPTFRAVSINPLPDETPGTIPKILLFVWSPEEDDPPLLLLDESPKFV